jgi:hypothetical protein
MVFRLPPEKIERITEETKHALSKARSGRNLGVVTLRRLVGKLQSTAACVRECRLHLNGLIGVLRRAESFGSAHPDEHAQADLVWWAESLHLFAVKPILFPSPAETFDTDASGTGWGAVCFPSTSMPPLRCADRWTQPIASSNQREMTAVLLALQAFARQLDWKDCSVRVRTDNLSCMSHINRMGGREPALWMIAERIHRVALARNIHLTAEYLPGIENTVADQLSRLELDLSSFQLHPEAFQEANERWGPFTLDCFAAQSNALLPRYVSYRSDPECLYTDFLSRPAVKSESLWCNPPFPLMGRLLIKIQSEQLRAVVLCPLWPAQPWWPIALSMMTDWPLLIPPDFDVFRMSTPEGLQTVTPKWSCVALRLSGMRCESAEWRQQLSTSLWRDGRMALMARLSERSILSLPSSCWPLSPEKAPNLERVFLMPLTSPTSLPGLCLCAYADEIPHLSGQPPTSE